MLPIIRYYLTLSILVFNALFSQLLLGQGGYSSLNYTDLFTSNVPGGVACYRIPSLLTTVNGDVLAAVDQRVPNCGDLKLNRDINIVMRRSTDNGETWTEVQSVVDYPDGESASDPSMILERESGDILLFYNYMNLDSAKDIYRLKVIRSCDNGVSWSPPTDITSQITAENWHSDFMFITSGRGIQTKSGALLHTLVNLDRGLYVFKSEDYGKTWFLLDESIAPADESKLVQLTDGTLMINSRVNQAGVRYVHLSDDGGTNWLTRPESTLPDPGCNASIIRYDNGNKSDSKRTLLFSNPNHPGQRKQLTIRISYDEGATWSQGKVVYPGSAAYSSMTVLNNGDIGILFERDDYQRNTFARFSLSWLNDNPSLSK